mmetsp:Transcript_32411/g.102978  ORF Transcript_32411/g.102978 Transcript_32411/m.102978 type:complete len:222 (+) Transcript_32411:546-1211(+)
MCTEPKLSGLSSMASSICLFTSSRRMRSAISFWASSVSAFSQSHLSRCCRSKVTLCPASTCAICTLRTSRTSPVRTARASSSFWNASSFRARSFSGLLRMSKSTCGSLADAGRSASERSAPFAGGGAMALAAAPSTSCTSTSVAPSPPNTCGTASASARARPLNTSAKADGALFTSWPMRALTPATLPAPPMSTSGRTSTSVATVMRIMAAPVWAQAQAQA